MISNSRPGFGLAEYRGCLLYTSEIEMVGSRTSVIALDYFLCEKVVDQTYTYAFFDPDVFISVLIASHLEFKIVKPNWLKEYMKERLSHLLTLI